MESETVVEEDINGSVWSPRTMLGVADQLCWMYEPQVTIETLQH